MGQTANVVTLKPRTLRAFEDYIHTAEEGMQPSLEGHAAFLWSDCSHERAQQVRRRQIVAQLWAGDWPVKIANGLIHDWVGAVMVPHVSVEQVLKLVQDYDHHKDIYAPEVMDSRLLSRDDNHFTILERLASPGSALFLGAMRMLGL